MFSDKLNSNEAIKYVQKVDFKENQANQKGFCEKRENKEIL